MSEVHYLVKSKSWQKKKSKTKQNKTQKQTNKTKQKQNKTKQKKQKQKKKKKHIKYNWYQMNKRYADYTSIDPSMVYDTSNQFSKGLNPHNILEASS